MNALTGTIRSSLADRQFRAGFDLVSSAAMNAIAGLAFWFVAARTFDESVVGVNATLISTMASVANFASLGMKNGLIRFMPGYGDQAKRLVTQTYAFTGLCGLVLTPIIAVVLANRVDELDALGSFTGIIAFTLASVVWTVFVLQDSVLVALERTALIPKANFVHALAKLAVLLVLAISAPKWGIFTAWTVPVIAIIVWVNVVAYRALRAGQTRASAARPEAGLARFAAGEHASAILNMGLGGLLPIYILAELGESPAAFFALAWTIAYNLMLVNSNVSVALLAAAAHDGDRLPQQTIKALKQMALFVVPGAVALIVLAPYGLRIFGESYEEGGTAVLRLFALTAIANIVVTASIGILRARRQVARLFGLYAVRTVLIGGLCVILALRYDLTGIGLGWLIGESVMAVLLATTHLRGLLSESSGAPAPL